MSTKSTLAAANPTLAREWHPTKNNGLTPEQVAPFSNKTVWWQCSKDPRHEWEAVIARRSNGATCGVCANRVIIPGVNDLASDATYGWLVTEWHEDNELTPQEVTAFSSKRKIKWRCSTNPEHIWEAPVARRTVQGSGCPHCNKPGKRASLPLVSDNPALMAEWHPSNIIDPTTVTIGSGKVVLWQCSTNPEHEWRSRIFSRAQMIRKGKGCPHCSGRIVDLKRNNLLTARPDLAKELHPDNTQPADKIYAHSVTPILWRCVDFPEHQWSAAPHSRVVKGTGCPLCLGREKQGLLTDHEEIARSWSEKNERSIEGITLGSGYKVFWKCLVNDSHPDWLATVADRVKRENCPECSAKKFSSRGEQEVADHLEGLGFTLSRNVRYPIEGVHEFDIYIPELNFAVDFNGVYWHSEQFKGRHYHEKKQDACRAAGVTLYEVWDDDWKFRKEIVLRGLAHRLNATERLKEILPDLPDIYVSRCYARKTRVEELSFTVASAFLSENHIQGAVSGSRYLGLLDQQDRVRAVMVLRSTGTGNSGEMRIERYATAGIVPGGFSKLLTWAEKNLPVTQWTTFADLSISDGSLYAKNGFVIDKVLPAAYSYLVNSERVHRMSFTDKKFRTDPRLEWMPGMTVKQLADLNGIARIYDSGKIRYVKEVSR